MRRIVPVTISLAALAALTGCSSSGGAAPELPDAVGDYLSLAAVCAEAPTDPATCTEQADEQQVVLDAAAATLSEAYGGAGATAMRYSTADYGSGFAVYAVAAESPALWTPTDTSEWEEYAQFQSPDKIMVDGDVQCQVRNSALAEVGEDVNEDALQVGVCQATTEDLTVRVMSTVDMTLADATAATQELFDALE